MKDAIQTKLETALESEVTSYTNEPDAKVKVGHLKLASVIAKMIRDEETQKADEKNREERLSLDKEKLKFEKSKFNFEKTKYKFEQEVEAQKIALSIQEQELEKLKLEFEKSKQLEAKKAARVDIAVKCALAGVALIPPILAFVGGIMTLKLEYNDMGRTPSTFKDFMRKI